MARPENEASYLASLVPPSLTAQRMSRRSILKGTLAGGAALSLPALLAACGDDGGGGGSSAAGSSSAAASSSTAESSSAAPAGASGTISFGSNASDEIPKGALQAVMDAFQTDNPDAEVKINTVDHNTFQEQINSYLQGSPDDVFTWFSGFRMRFFADKGLAGDISDVWANVSGMSDALKTASTGDDGKQYFVPFTNYPWAIFYRKSVFEEKGYEIPTKLDDLVALSKKMQGDGLVPIAFGDKDGWPAMGTFDQLNFRMNGYQFHVDLMAGNEAWDDPKTKAVFDQWRELLPYHQSDSLGRTWQEAAQTLQQKKAGMYLLGMFVGQQFPAEDIEDLDFFPFPEIDPAVGADVIEAPIDGFMMAKSPKNEEGAKALLAYLATAPAEDISVKTDPTVIAVSSDADSSGYSSLQKKAVELIGGAANITQFLDRDARPDFASNVMIPSIQQFIGNPNDVDSLCSSIEKQKKSIYAS